MQDKTSFIDHDSYEWMSSYLLKPRISTAECTKTDLRRQLRQVSVHRSESDNIDLGLVAPLPSLAVTKIYRNFTCISSMLRLCTTLPWSAWTITACTEQQVS